MKTHHLAWVFSAASLLGCSNDVTTFPGGAGGAGSTGSTGGIGTTSTGTGTTASEWAQFCQALADREAKCNPNGTSPYTKCLASQQCYADAVYSAAQKPLRDCLVNRACNVKDDACYADPSHQSPAFAKFQQDCVAKHATCKASGATFSDDVCASPVISDAVINAIGACLAKDCPAVPGCIADVKKAMIDSCPFF